MKPTLLVLAAGMGSRYGGLKQLDGIGPNGETIIDYSIFDAARSGFGKVVFIIRNSFEQDFREKILKKYLHLIPIEIVFQELDKLPKGFTLPLDRIKPWGTNHALMMGKNVIHEPFVTINADDFYGRESFKLLSDFLQTISNKQNIYAMVGYRIENTLSENGSVARGICSTDADSFLTSVIERTCIIRDIDGQIKYKDDDGNLMTININTLVSMNMWGFTLEYFHYSHERFVDFLLHNKDNLKEEFYIPSVVNHLIVTGQIKVKVLDTHSKWFGMTYINDRVTAMIKIRELIEMGEYPEKLF